MNSIRLVMGVCCLLLCGCAERELPRTEGHVTVSGQVSLDGVAVDGAEISLKPLAPAPTEGTGSEYIAAIHQGKFHLDVPPSEYRIEIRRYVSGADRSDNADTPGKPQQVIPKRWNDESELTATVSEKQTSPLLFALKSAAP